MKSAVIVFPGSNCDRDVAVAVAKVTGVAPYMVWHEAPRLPRVDLIILPGGFSYGDYLRAGSIAAQSSLMGAVKKAADDGVAVLGICNGFQVLTEMGLLPGALLCNRHLKFLCKNVHLRVETTAAPFSHLYEKHQVLRLPIAHAQGCYVAQSATLDMLDKENRVALRYCDAQGNTTMGNPNGSMGNIAGIVNKKGNVLGMMPHPERACEALFGLEDGRLLFDGLARSVA